MKVRDPLIVGPIASNRDKVELRYRAAHANPRPRVHGTADQQLTAFELTALRELSRELERDNIVVSAAYDRIEDLVVGDGINLQIQADNSKWASTVEQLWIDYWNEFADHSRRFKGMELDRILLRTYLRDGDYAIYKRKSDYELLVIEGDRISSPFAIDNQWVDGIRISKSGRIVSLNIRNDDNSEVKLSAKDTLFVARRERISQTRGLPILACAATHFDDIDSYIEACIVGSRTSVAHAIAITKDADPESPTQTDKHRDIESGGILELNPGEDVKNVGSTLQMAEFGPFMTKMMRVSGLKLALSLEVLSLDFSETNFSSARASIQLVKRAMNRLHKTMLIQVYQPLFKWKLDQWVAEGKVEAPKGRYQITSLPPKEIQVDPLKEAMANQILAKTFSTNRDICLGYGRDFDDVMKQRSTEIKNAQKIADKLSAETGIKDLSWRDIIGSKLETDVDYFKYLNGDEDEEIPQAA